MPALRFDTGAGLTNPNGKMPLGRLSSAGQSNLSNSGDCPAGTWQVSDPPGKSAGFRRSPAIPHRFGLRESAVQFVVQQ